MSDFLKLERDGPVARLVLTRSPVNALDEPTLNEMYDLLIQVENVDDCKVLVVESGIKDIYCTGGDMKFWPVAYPDRADLVSRSGRRVFEKIENLNKPSLAVIDGAVIGDGLCLPLACDLRLASERTSFQLPEVEYGFIPGWGTVGRLVRAVGHTKAAEILLLGQTIKPGCIAEMGLVNWVVSTHEINDFAQRLAGQLSQKPPLALGQARKALRGFRQNGQETTTEQELSCFKTVWGGDEWATGVKRVFKAKI